jgi:hypothetical protein
MALGDGITVSEHGTICADGPDGVATYAFAVLCSAVSFRLKSGRSMYRNQECRMANNYGWSNVKRFGPKLADDLDEIRAQLGLEPIERTR